MIRQNGLKYSTWRRYAYDGNPEDLQTRSTKPAVGTDGSRAFPFYLEVARDK